MVKYYLVINDAEKSYLIGRFTEMILPDKKRQLSISLYQEDSSAGDSALVDLSQYYAENSITHIVVKDAKDKVVYESSNYSKLNSCSATLHNITDPEDDFCGMEYTIAAEAEIA